MSCKVLCQIYIIPVGHTPQNPNILKNGIIKECLFHLGYRYFLSLLQPQPGFQEFIHVIIHIFHTLEVSPVFRKGTGHFSPISIQTAGRFGPIPFPSGHFGLGRCFGPMSVVGHFGPILAGHFGPLYFI